MVYLSDWPDAVQDRVLNQELPEYDLTPCVSGPPLSARRVAIVTTSGIHRKDDTPFSLGGGDYRIIPDDTDMNDLVMSHVSTNFDRTGFQQDLNVCFPIDRLRELKNQGVIGSIASNHYAFMGATPPPLMAAAAKDLAARLQEDNVDGVVFTPV